MRQHRPLGVGSDENDARARVTGGGRHFDRHAQPPHIAEAEPAQFVGPHFPGVSRFSS